MEIKKKLKLPFLNILVVIAALGYFVDIYDLLLFGILRIPSLKELGLSGQALLDKGIMLLNMQMAGMLLGGIFWGILGDKKGRLSVLFGSILLYSIANIANAFVNSVETYALWRFIAGIGLAGELGAGITLVAETLPKQYRGYGTMITAAFGILGAVVAGFIASHFSWRMNYCIGGGLGLGLLLLRIGAYESGLYAGLLEKTSVTRGRFLALFSDKKIFIKYITCILIGIPLWYAVGILVTFSPEFGKALHINDSLAAAKAIMWTYGGLAVGDIASGLISQILKSRKRAVLLFLGFTLASVLLLLNLPAVSAAVYYWCCFALGFSTGYWAVFVTIAAEQFGTNIRATVATTVPNFVRGSVIPLTLLFQWIKHISTIYWAGLSLGLLCITIAVIALYFLEETFSKDLNFVENL